MGNISPAVRITDYVHKFASQAPTREAVICAEQRLNYRQLETRVIACAKALLDAGVSAGDRVALLSSPRLEYYELFLATTGIGAIWLGLNPKHSYDEIAHVIDDAKPKLLFTLAEFEGRQFEQDMQQVLDRFDFIEQLVVIDQVFSGAISYSAFLDKAKTVADADYHAAAAAVSKLSPALIVYTSGTTGRPKGAVLSHYGLCFGATIQTQHFLVDKPRVICSMPINHVACVADICSTTLVVGGTIVLQQRFVPSLYLQTIEREKINIWGGVPTMFLLQLNQPDFNDYDLSSVELVLWGGAAMPETAIKQLQTLGARLMAAYGMTETAAHTTYSRAHAGLEELSNSIGCPDPNMPCRIVNDEGEPCPPGTSGELQFKGQYLFLRYHNRAAASRAAFSDDGWFKTGDLAYWRSDGNISLVGRKSEMYKSGGYNIYPREIELQLEQLAQVDVAAVVAIPDPMYQEVGVAFVAGQHTDQLSGERLRAHCRSGLANYKIPKQFHILTELPLLANGKIDKQALRQTALNQGTQRAD
ncbi:MAG: acyl--CoA ligase [Cellvibrionaceae bacterium]|nr:acyl--CoA ligase [Cellvibrionaceae bacterium]